MAKAPAIGEVEIVRLNKKNIEYIARRSGESPENLRAVLTLAHEQGRSPKMRYIVVAD